MLRYCLKCRKNTGNPDSKILKTKNSEQLCNQNALFVELKNQDL